MLVGVKALIAPPTLEEPTRGQLHVTLEMPALCNPDLRPGRCACAASQSHVGRHCVLTRDRTRRPSDAVLDLSHRFAQLLASAHVVDLDALCITPHAACWRLCVDAHVLHDDGCVLDVALLAALGALGTTNLPALQLATNGRLQAVDKVEGEAAAPMACDARQLALRRVPAGVSCGLYKGHVLVDPTREEEALMQALVSCCWCEQAQHAGSNGDVGDSRSKPLLAVHKAGGEAGASVKTLVQCIAASQQRHGDVVTALASAGVRML